jgi:hypothetical protein
MLEQVRAPIGMRTGIIVFGFVVVALFLGLLGSEVMREYDRSLERH